jgi:hypothetical protein
MRSGYLYSMATVAIGVIGAVFIGFARPYPVIMVFFSVFLFLPPFLVFFYLAVLELIWGDRLGGGGGPERGDEPVPVADTLLVELAAHPGSSRLREAA